MQIEKKYFEGILDADSVDILVPPNAWVNAENVRYGTTDAGVIGTVESVGSNRSVTGNVITLNEQYVIGYAVEEVRNRIVYFIWFDVPILVRIMCYDLTLNTLTGFSPFLVLSDNQVTGGLGFSKYNPIHSAKIVNGILYWVDGLNEARSVNIDAGIKSNNPLYVTDAIPYTFPLAQADITLIKEPLALAPNIQKDTDGTFDNNFIANNSFEFAFQAVYYTNESTILGTFSNASRLNKVTDTFNRIIVTMDIAQQVSQLIRMVNLWVRVGTSCFLIKTWDRDVTSEATEIDNQNNGSQVLPYFFYNNVIGEFLNQASALKPFESIPLQPVALEVAKNRLFLGGGIKGYDSPLTTSLSYMLTSVDIAGAAALNKNLISVQYGHLFGAGTPDTYSGWMVYLTEISPIGYYAVIGAETVCSACPFPPPMPATPVTTSLAGLVFRGATQTDVQNSINTDFSANIGNIPLYVTTSNMLAITGLGVTTYDIYKSKSQYRIGVVFYDFAMRKCGVVSQTIPPTGSDIPGSLVSIPPRDFALTSGISSIVWTLDNTNALIEIPVWAAYYTVVLTLNLRTRYFLEAFQNTSNAKYATKDADGVYVFTSTSYTTAAVGIGLDTTSLVQAGLGYVFTQGDLCYLIKTDNSSYELAVIGQSGKYIIVNVPAGGIGDFSTFQVVYEIYTPYTASLQEPFYEVGNMYKVSNPGTALRTYATTSDTLLPDAYALTRNFESATYFAEAMSPNDRLFFPWENDSGKVNLITKIGQQTKPYSISFSNTFIPGTSVNGLSSFEALNEYTLPQETGYIQKLQLTSKVQNEQGVIMLAINTIETSSLYLGETQIVDQTGSTQFFAASDNVISTVNILKGSYGTMNPESVCEYRGSVYWLDIDSDRFVRYSTNGLFPISDYRMTRFWKQFCKQFKSMSRAQFEQLQSRPYVFCGVDPKHDELLVSIPRLLQDPPNGYLPNYPSIAYPFDIYDGQPKTLVFCIREELSHWQGAYTFYSSMFIPFKGDIYSTLKNHLYIQNRTDSYCNFFGDQFKSRVMAICNQQPSEVKVYNDVAVEGNMVPKFTYFQSINPWNQASDLVDFDWEFQEGVFYCFIYRNRLMPSAFGIAPNGLIDGEKMRTTALRVMLEWDITTTPLELKFFNIGYSASLGHTVNVKR